VAVELFEIEFDIDGTFVNVELEPVERLDEVDKFEFCDAIEPQFDPVPIELVKLI